MNMQTNTDTAKRYKVLVMATAMLGLWEEAAPHLGISSNLDYDDEIDSLLKNANLKIRTKNEEGINFGLKIIKITNVDEFCNLLENKSG